MTSVQHMVFTYWTVGHIQARALARQFDPHMHATYCVVLLKKGAAEIRSRRWSNTVRAGDVFFFNPFEVHSGQSISELAEYDSLYLSEHALCALLRRDVSTGSPRIETGFLRACDRTEQLAQTVSCSDPGAIREALGHLLLACDYAPTVLAPSESSLPEKTRALIDQSYTSAIRSHHLAAEIGVHKSHLIRSFTHAVGLTPETYIRQLRVSRAQELICSGQGLSDIAQSLGFCDQAHLSREFKKVFGVPPGAVTRAARLAVQA